jgi:hypothetical protein
MRRSVSPTGGAKAGRSASTPQVQWLRGTSQQALQPNLTRGMGGTSCGNGCVQGKPSRAAAAAGLMDLRRWFRRWRCLGRTLQISSAAQRAA